MKLLGPLLLGAARLMAVPAWIRWGVLAGYAGVVTWLMLTPSPPGLVIKALDLFPQVDKVLHFLVYGVLALLLRWALTVHHQLRAGFTTVVLGAVAYGLFMECLQALLVAYARSFEWMDIVSNSLGAFAFWGGAEWLARRVAAAEQVFKNPEPQIPT